MSVNTSANTEIEIDESNHFFLAVCQFRTRAIIVITNPIGIIGDDQNVFV